jgi:hypothetical protein
LATRRDEATDLTSFFRQSEWAPDCETVILLLMEEEALEIEEDGRQHEFGDRQAMLALGLRLGHMAELVGKLAALGDGSDYIGCSRSASHGSIHTSGPPSKLDRGV